jgi:2-polyprenyl-3-methyl-5-hydroxy-6-metoxy-1,4-benzoquinol methylase
MAASETERNRAAWNAGRYEAWVKAEGAPEEAAKAIAADPRHAARRILPYLGDVAGKRVCNLQGSMGKVAVALALLRGAVTVIDFAEENRRYALKLAAAAGVSLNYIVRDVMEASALGLKPFDAVAMELGVLHYHQDLDAFFAVCAAITARGGMLVLCDFHPVQRKLFSPFAADPRNYFDAALITGDVPNPAGEGGPLGQCVYRFWTLGEIVTAAVGAGFDLLRLDETPDWTNPAIPGAFTLAARRR